MTDDRRDLSQHRADHCPINDLYTVGDVLVTELVIKDVVNNGWRWNLHVSYGATKVTAGKTHRTQAAATRELERWRKRLVNPSWYPR